MLVNFKKVKAERPVAPEWSNEQIQTTFKSIKEAQATGRAVFLAGLNRRAGFTSTTSNETPKTADFVKAAKQLTQATKVPNTVVLIHRDWLHFRVTNPVIHKNTKVWIIPDSMAPDSPEVGKNAPRTPSFEILWDAGGGNKAIDLSALQDKEIDKTRPVGVLYKDYFGRVNLKSIKTSYRLLWLLAGPIAEIQYWNVISKNSSMTRTSKEPDSTVRTWPFGVDSGFSKMVTWNLLIERNPSRSMLMQDA